MSLYERFQAIQTIGDCMIEWVLRAAPTQDGDDVRPHEGRDLGPVLSGEGEAEAPQPHRNQGPSKFFDV